MCRLVICNVNNVQYIHAIWGRRGIVECVQSSVAYFGGGEQTTLAVGGVGGGN